LCKCIYVKHNNINSNDNTSFYIYKMNKVITVVVQEIIESEIFLRKFRKKKVNKYLLTSYQNNNILS